jgi:hypothetical protein
LAHARNPGEDRLGLIMVLAWSVFASMIVWRLGNLWLAVGAHAGWDWGESYFYGVRDSGWQAEGHLLNPQVHGPAWLSGGTVGPEGSVLTLVALAIMTVWLWRRTRTVGLILGARIDTNDRKSFRD